MMDNDGVDDLNAWRERLDMNPHVIVGKPVIRGTRLSVELIIGFLAAGLSREDIFDSYPGVTEEDIRACLHFAHLLLETEKSYWASSPLNLRKEPDA